MLVDAEPSDEDEEDEIVLKKGDPAQYGQIFKNEEEEPIAVG